MNIQEGIQQPREQREAAQRHTRARPKTSTQLLVRAPRHSTATCGRSLHTAAWNLRFYLVIVLNSQSAVGDWMPLISCMGNTSIYKAHKPPDCQHRTLTLTLLSLPKTKDNPSLTGMHCSSSCGSSSRQCQSSWMQKELCPLWATHGHVGGQWLATSSYLWWGTSSVAGILLALSF